MLFKNQTRYSRGLWTPRSIDLSVKIRLCLTLIRSILLYAVEAHTWLSDVETLEKLQNRALRHIARSAVDVSRERAQDLWQRLRVRCKFRDYSGQRKWLREETYPEKERTDVDEVMRAMRFGRLSFERDRHRRRDSSVPCRPDDLRRFVSKIEETERALENIRTAADVLGMELPREKPSRDQKWGEWLLTIPTTNTRKLLSYTTRSDLWSGIPSEILTSEKYAAKARGERDLKIHHRQWDWQSAHDAQTLSRLEVKTETQGVDRVKKWSCSYCQKEFSTRSNRIPHERISCRNRPPHVSAQASTTSESIVSEH